MSKFKLIIINLLLICICFIGTSCSDICKNTVVKQITTSDNKYTITAFIRDGGATTAFSPQVILLKKDHNLKDSSTGNIFVGNRSDYIDLEWENKDTLIIKHKCSEKEIFKQETKLKGINIEYIKLDDNN